MAFVTFLNELSFPSGQLNAHDAVAAVVGLVKTLRGLKAIHTDTALHSSVSLPDIPLGEGLWLGPVMSAGEARDEWRFIRSIQNRSPFTAGLANPVGGETEYQHGRVTSAGLGLSHALGTLSVSFPTDGWLHATINVQRLHLGATGMIDEETVSIVHAAVPEHIVTNEEWIRSAWIAEVADGDELWQRRAELFPHLKFLPDVEGNCTSLSRAMYWWRPSGTL